MFICPKSSIFSFSTILPVVTYVLRLGIQLQETEWSRSVWSLPFEVFSKISLISISFGTALVSKFPETDILYVSLIIHSHSYLDDRTVSPMARPLEFSIGPTEAIWPAAKLS